jgi:acetyltransferase-like isoleucine patch superfamily enzyme
MSENLPQTETAFVAAERPRSLRRRLATSQGRLARFVRWAYWSVHRFSVPAPMIVVKPLVWLFLAIRTAWHFALRVFICEPFFKAHCTRYGSNLHTDCHLHWISGRGDIIVGNNVRMDGRIDITFAARFSDRPVLEIGDNSGIGNGCHFTIGKKISIGNNCKFSGDTLVMDSNGHLTDPVPRWAGDPPSSEDIRPVIIRDGVWIGKQCIIFPGVRIGEGSVISAGSVVRGHVPAYSVVAGNPARVMFRLQRPAEARDAE